MSDMHEFSDRVVFLGVKRGPMKGSKNKRGGKRACGPPPGEALSEKEGEEGYVEEDEGAAVVESVANMDLCA